MFYLWLWLVALLVAACGFGLAFWADGHSDRLGDVGAYAGVGIMAVAVLTALWVTVARLL